ncbi:hypothetical protein B0H11DRAFT_2210131 [Mycena galericulata]|nr:hypothetical protein B0H11DRAFT_2210131 [Mycena galericulata]
MTSSNASSWPEKVDYVHIHAVHPDNKKIFKTTAVSPTDIRTNRNNISMACTVCHKSDEDAELRKCGKCKGVWYCSKQCQTAHRPQHKKHCKAGEVHGIQKLIQNFTSNVVLNRHLQACFIQHFPVLLNEPRSVLSTPFVARVDIGVDPADIPDFFRIFNNEPDAPRAAQLQGMLQINAFTPLEPAPRTLDELTPARRRVWESAREGGAAYETEPIAVVALGRGDFGQQITCALPIEDDARAIVRRACPWTVKSAFTGKVTEAPFNIETCMEFINTHIRADKKNRLLLRTEMLEEDAQVIRDAAAKADKRAAQLLRRRMARERIFQPVVLVDGVPGKMVVDMNE